MIVKKSGGRIYGAQLTVAERKAMNIEIEKQLAEYTRKHQAEFDALVKRYEMEDEDDVWLCTQKLKEMGVDIEQWEREKE